MVHATRTLLSETASQMWAAAGQFFSGLITTKPPVEKNSEGLWGKRWEAAGWGFERERRMRGKRGGKKLQPLRNLLHFISLIDFIYDDLPLTFNNYL